MKTKIILICSSIWLGMFLCLAGTLFYLLQTPHVPTSIFFLLFLLNFLLISACISTITIGILALWRKLRPRKKTDD